MDSKFWGVYCIVCVIDIVFGGLLMFVLGYFSV